MKSLKYITLLTLLAGALTPSCIKKLDEAYFNPNAPTVITPADLLPPITYQMAMNLEEDFMYVGQQHRILP